MANDSFLNVNHDYKLNEIRQTFKPRQPEYELVVTSRGGQLLALNGYLFRLNYKRKDRIYWKCKTWGCLSTAIMSNKQELISFRENHNHSNDRPSIRNRSTASSLKRIPKPERRFLKSPTIDGLQFKFQDDQQSALSNTTTLQLEHAIKTEVVAADLISAYECSPYLPGINWYPQQQIAIIANVQYGKEAMEVQSAVAAATGTIIGQSEVETYEPEPVHTIQNSKIRINQEKDLSVSFSASSRPATVFKKTYVDPEHADGMMKSLATLWRKRRLCDAKICSGNKNVILHRLVLFAASPHLMEKNITDGADLEVNLPPGISEDGLKIFVSFLYDGVLNLNEHLYKDVERISNLLKVDKIQKHCREFAASLNEHKQMTSSPSMLTPRRRDSLPKSHKQNNRQTVVLTLSDDSNPADVTFENQEQNVGLSHSHLEDVHNTLLDERIQSLSEQQHNYLTSHQNQFPSTSQASSMSLQSSSVSAIPSECGIKTEPIEILDDDVTDYNLSQEDIKQCKPNINHSGKGYSDDGSNSELHRRSSQGHISSKVTRTYMTPSKCESGIELTPMESISTCATTGASPYPVSLVASSGETFPLYTLSSNHS